LVAPQYFEFGKSLMQVIVDALRPKDFGQHGDRAVQEGWAYIDEKMASLKAQFLACGKDFTAVDMNAKTKILQGLVEKTRNAQFGVVVMARRNEKRRRGRNNSLAYHIGQD
jgi:hypothetical protein